MHHDNGTNQLMGELCSLASCVVVTVYAPNYSLLIACELLVTCVPTAHLSCANACAVLAVQLMAGYNVGY